MAFNALFHHLCIMHSFLAPTLKHEVVQGKKKLVSRLTLTSSLFTPHSHHPTFQLFVSSHTSAVGIIFTQIHKEFIMPTGKTLLLAIWFAAAALPYSSTIASPLLSRFHSLNLNISSANVTGLVNNAPAAKDISGIHLLLDNDVDSQTPKYPLILLSKPRVYNDSLSICTLLGESTYGSTTWLHLSHLFF